jgi:ribonuclease VapC
MKKVFDASAVLAFLFNEPGAEKAGPDIPQGVINTVNAAEVMAVLVRKGMPVPDAHRALVLTGLTLTNFGTAEATQSAELLCAQFRSRGISLGDRACMATAVCKKLPVVSADRKWAGLAVTGLQLELIR